MADVLDAAPDDELTRLGERLHTILGLPVTVGVDAKAKPPGAPPLVVLYPVEAPHEAPGDQVASILDRNLTCLAVLYAPPPFKKLSYLLTLFFRALEKQAADVDDEGNCIGLFWERDKENWDTTPDATIRGQSVEVFFRVRLSVDRADSTFGLVEKTTIQEEP